MSIDPKSGRSQAEARFDKAVRTNEEARTIIETERDALRKKTARLRKLRLAKEAEEAAAPVEQKPVAKKKKAAPKKK